MWVMDERKCSLHAFVPSFALGIIASALKRKTGLHSSYSHRVLWLVTQAHGAVEKEARILHGEQTRTLWHKKKKTCNGIQIPRMKAQLFAPNARHKLLTRASKAPTCQAPPHFYPLLAGFKVEENRRGRCLRWPGRQTCSGFFKARSKSRNCCSSGGFVSRHFKGCRFATVYYTGCQQDKILETMLLLISLDDMCQCWWKATSEVRQQWDKSFAFRRRSTWKLGGQVKKNTFWMKVNCDKL